MTKEIVLPKYLKDNKYAKAELKRIKDSLALTDYCELDYAALDVYLGQYAIYQEAMENIDQYGLVIIPADPTKRQYMNPSYMIAKQALDSLYKYITILGFSTEARKMLKEKLDKTKINPILATLGKK